MYNFNKLHKPNWKNKKADVRFYLYYKAGWLENTYFDNTFTVYFKYKLWKIHVLNIFLKG